MKKKSILLFPAGALLALAAAGHSASTAPAVSSSDLIAARQAGMKMSGPILFGQLKPAAAGTGELKGVAGAAGALAAWGSAMPALFPAGSGGATSLAKPELWANKADFDQKAAAFAAAARAAADAAKAEDRAAFAAQVAVLQQSCGGCHKSYRVEEQHP
jgi:cytochrome c556